MMRILAIATGCMLLSAPAIAIEQARFKQDGFKEEREILSNNPMFANEIRTGDIDVNKLGIATIDVNDDGQKEWFVHDYNPYSCGSQGCSTYVFQKQGTQYLHIMRMIAGDTIAVGDKSSNANGYRDIYVKGPSGDLVRWSFDGREYTHND